MPAGRPRKKKEVSYWLEHGDNLIQHFEGDAKLKKQLETKRCALHKSNKSGNQKESQQICDELNEFKDKLGDNWKKWGDRIRQRSKDYNIVKMTLSPSLIKEYIEFSRDSNIALFDLIETLPKLLMQSSIPSYKVLLESVTAKKAGAKKSPKKKIKRKLEKQISPFA